MEKHFYQKTSYLVFNIIVIIVVISSLVLNQLGYISGLMYFIIETPIFITTIVVFVQQTRYMIKDKKLRNQAEPKVSIEPAAGILSNPGDAIITIDEFRYLIESPFRKEGFRAKNSDTFYSYLSSHNLLKPISSKMVKWLKKSMRLSDTAMKENNLCYVFRDLRVADSNNPLFLCSVGNDKMMLIIAIEQLRVSKESRTLKHVTALINAASSHERANYANGGLIDAFNLFKDGLMKPKVFKTKDTVGYCFIYEN